MAKLDFLGQHDFTMGDCICGANEIAVLDALVSKMCEVRGDHQWRPRKPLAPNWSPDEDCTDCGIRLSDIIGHRESPKCRGKKDITDCAHMHFVVQANVCRMLDDKDPTVVVGFYADITVKCEVCAKPFQFLGLNAGVDTQGARVSLDGLEARMALTPQGAQPNPLQRMQFNISKFDG